VPRARSLLTGRRPIAGAGEFNAGLKMRDVSPVMGLLAPGMVAFAFVAAVAWRRVAYRWWEFAAPWVAPVVWLSLNYAVPRDQPKGLGNLIEILGLSMLPAAYILMRAIAWKSRPRYVNGFTVLGGAAICAAIIYFVFPSIPE